MASIVMSKRISPLFDRRGQQGLLPFALLSIIVMIPSFAAGDTPLENSAQIPAPAAITAEIDQASAAEPAVLRMAEIAVADTSPAHMPATLEADATMSAPVAELPSDAAVADTSPVHAPATLEADATMSAPVAVLPSDAAVADTSPVHAPATLEADATMSEPVATLPSEAMAQSSVAPAAIQFVAVTMVDAPASDQHTDAAEHAVSEPAAMVHDHAVSEVMPKQPRAADVAAEPAVDAVAETPADSSAKPSADAEAVSAIEPIEKVIENAPSDATPGSLFEVIFSFSLVIGLMLLFLWGVKRWQPKFVPGRSGLEIRAMLSLGGRDRLVVVQAGDRQVLLGVSPGRITLLGDYDELLAQPEDAKASAGDTFKQLLKRQ